MRSAAAVRGIWASWRLSYDDPGRCAHPDTTLEGKSQRLLDTTLGNKPDYRSTLYLHTLFKQVSYRRPLRGRRGRLSPFPTLTCSVRAPVAFSIGDLGGSTEGFLLRGAFFELEISRWLLLVFLLFILLAL